MRSKHMRSNIDRVILVLLKWCGGVVFLTSVVTNGATAGTIRSDRDDALYLQLADEPEYDAVGMIQWDEDGSAYNGSGVVIADEWVLTAGHIVGGNDAAGGGISRMRFRVGGRTYTVAEWIPHPVWTSTNGSIETGVDLGLVRLARPSLVDSAVVYEDRDEQSEIGTIVGFGSTGTGTTGNTITTTQKRAGNNVIDLVQDKIIEVDFDNPTRRRDSSMGSSTPLDLEYLPASGDSGGGLFIDTPDGTKLVGITSYTAAIDAWVDSDYGDIGGFIRVSSYLDWIESLVGDLSALLGDFNNDRLLTAEDVDILTREIGHSIDRQFDLNGDGEVTLADRTFWVENIVETNFGDVNLDGVVNDADRLLLNASLFTEETGWATGDLNGDGSTDGSDWNIWWDNLGRLGAGSAAVPEPTTGALLGVLLAAMAVVRRHFNG